MFQQFNPTSGRRLVRRLTGCLTVLAAVLLTLITPRAGAQAACSVAYTISSQWGGGFGAAITLNNTGTTAWSNWTLTWSFANGQTVSQLWNGIETQSGANVTVTNESYNGSIPAGGSYNGMGFNGTWNNVTNAIPTSFAVNGVTCGAKTPSFTLSPSASSLSIAQGASGTDTISVADVNGFTGSVTLAATGLPSGVTATFGTNPTTGTSVVTFAASSTASTGTSTVTITGTSGSVTASTTIALTVTAKAGFTIAPSASTLSLTQGKTATDTVTVTDTGGFTGSVTLSNSTLPTGVTVAYGTNPTTGSSVLTFTASATATVGTSTVTITGTSGTTTATTTIALTVVANTGSFTLSRSAATLSIAQGASGTDTITVTDVSPFTGSVTLAASGLPTGVTAAFATNPTTATSVLTLTASSTATLGAATVTITGTSGSLTASTTIALTITAKAGFTIAPSASTLSVTQAKTATDTITVTDTGGFTGSVTLSNSTLPTGVTVAYGTNPTTGSSVLTFTASSTATVGTSTITITGTSGTTTATTTIALTVVSASTGSFTLAASPTALSIAQGATGTDTITVTDVSPFAGSVTLAASGLPTGVTAAFATNPATSTSVVTFTVAATATAATSTITVTGTSGTLTASTTIALTVTAGTTGYTTFQQHFVDLYTDIHTSSNGYFGTATNGDLIPYHSVETLMAEAPDYGHETSSETYSYWVWLETLYGGLTKNWTGLQTAWTSLQDNMIPSATLQPTNAGYNASSPATYAPEHPLPSTYPSVLTSSVSVGTDPLASQLSATYGTTNMYSMHWIIDTDNFYGFGQQEDGVTKPSCMNTFQRGANESVWLTVPQPCWDALKYGSQSNGYLDLFTAPSPYTAQWKYTDAPDADARTVQAMYWAEQYANAQGGSSVVTALLPKAAELGDYLRYSFFDKYFKAIGCTGASASATSCAAGSGYNSAHYMLGWYFAWGGALPADGSWAWRIGDGTTHFGYQNPVAAYALSKDAGISGKLPTQSVTDWSTSLERQLEFYRWLQSDEGAIAGGATNSWEGSYSPTPTGDATFYNMAYDWQPVYHNPPSNQWFGMQVWSMERLAEYYYITGDSKAATVLNSWIPWAEKVTTVNSNGTFTLPGSLCWDNSPGQGDTTNPWNDATCGLVDSSTTNMPATNWNATAQDWTTVPLNPNLHVRITGTSTDIGEAGSLAKALSYYSAAVGKWGTSGTPDATSEALAKSLLTGIWTNYRDSIGISVAETRSDYCTTTTSQSTEGGTTLNGGFGATVFVPSAWAPGTMPAGEDVTVSPQPTFLSLRPKYKNDPNYALLESSCAAGTGPTINYHRFWAQVDIASAYEVFANLFPGN
jgi:hypothetical protein